MARRLSRQPSETSHHFTLGKCQGRGQEHSIQIPEGSCGMAFEADRRLMYGLAKLDVAFPKWKNLQEQSFIFRELEVNTRKDSL